MTLTGKQKRYLRDLGHTLRPLVQLGKSGVTPNVIKQIRDNLRAHELIKVHIRGTHGPERNILANTLATESNSELIQVLGCMVLLYLPHPDSPKIQLPHPK